MLNEMWLEVTRNAALEDAWKFIKEVVPRNTHYHLDPDEMKWLGTLVVAHVGDPKFMNILSLALEAAYRLGEQA